jgi:hypothetical protein
MHPREEAVSRISRPARVLEPSPPAVHEAPWFADDPVAGPGVSPIGSGPGTWDKAVHANASLKGFASEHWLGAWKRLGPVPEHLVEVRLALHRVAEDTMKPAREAAEGAKFGLRWTRGGFGTPFFGADEQIRVEGARLIRQSGARVVEDDPIEVDEVAARFVGDWFGFAFSVLEELRAGAPDGDATRVQIWPEHFDAAIELGSEEAGERAAFGFSPGDENHPEPYVYVAPWSSEGFEELPFAALLAAPDQRAAALEFLRARIAPSTGSA